MAADGDPATGYLIYWNGRGDVPGEPAGWQGIGGTSGAAPLWAALLALTDGVARVLGRPGRLRQSGPVPGGRLRRTPRTSTTSRTGNNDFTGTNGGRYAAGPGYDPATGLGTPNAASLAGALCANTIRIATPGAQRSNRPDHRCRCACTRPPPRARRSPTPPRGLPPGLKVNAATGRITGHPTRAGRFTVRASAHDSQSQTAGTSFVVDGRRGAGDLAAVAPADGHRPAARLHRHRRQARARPPDAAGHRAACPDHRHRPRRRRHQHRAHGRRTCGSPTPHHAGRC